MKSRLLAMAVMGAIAASGFGALSHPVPVPRVTVSDKKKRGLFNDLVLPSSQSRIGTRYSRRTVAMDKRAAVKRRNRARNKAAARG